MLPMVEGQVHEKFLSHSSHKSLVFTCLSNSFCEELWLF